MKVQIEKQHMLAWMGLTEMKQSAFLLIPFPLAFQHLLLKYLFNPVTFSWLLLCTRDKSKGRWAEQNVLMLFTFNTSHGQCIWQGPTFFLTLLSSCVGWCVIG